MADIEQADTGPSPSGRRFPAFLTGRRGLIFGAGLLVVIVVAVVIVGGGGNTVKGSIKLQAGIAADAITFEGTFPEVNAPCRGEGGYSDIDAGSEVEVKDQDGTLLAMGSLQRGALSDVVEGALLHCEFLFSVPDVPSAKFYSLEVGSRGELSYSHKEMEEKDWTVRFIVDDLSS